MNCNLIDADYLLSYSLSLQPRTTNMATSLSGLTQQSNANVLAVKLMTQLQLEQQQEEGEESNIIGCDDALHE